MMQTFNLIPQFDPRSSPFLEHTRIKKCVYEVHVRTVIAFFLFNSVEGVLCVLVGEDIEGTDNCLLEQQLQLHSACDSRHYSRSFFFLSLSLPISLHWDLLSSCLCFPLIPLLSYPPLSCPPHLSSLFPSITWSSPSLPHMFITFLPPLFFHSLSHSLSLSFTDPLPVSRRVTSIHTILLFHSLHFSNITFINIIIINLVTITITMLDISHTTHSISSINV